VPGRRISHPTIRCPWPEGQSSTRNRRRLETEIGAVGGFADPLGFFRGMASSAWPQQLTTRRSLDPASEKIPK
jgi:hypothetical protein